MTHRLKKRERTQNWSFEEKNLLLKLCEERLDILETKRSDQTSIAKKSEAWQQLRTEFISELGIERDLGRLKEQWQRMKCQTRSELQDFAKRLRRHESCADGDEPNPPSRMSIEVWRVMESARRYFRGAESDEPSDPITEEINWSLSELERHSLNEENEREPVPSLLCETQVNPDYDDSKTFTPPTPHNNNTLEKRINETLLTLLETKKIEQRKRLQLVEEQLKAARLQTETARLNKRLAQYRLETALSCRKRHISPSLSPSPSPEKCDVSKTNCIDI